MIKITESTSSMSLTDSRNELEEQYEEKIGLMNEGDIQTIDSLFNRFDRFFADSEVFYRERLTHLLIDIQQLLSDY